MHDVTLTPEPLALVVDEAGELKPWTSRVERRLSQMRGMYADPAAERALLDDGDPLVYEVFQHDMPEHVGELVVCTTRLHPGVVGEELFMTKGHFHEQRDRAEVYYGLSGQGSLVVAYEGEHRTVPMEAGTVAYVPPLWAHRTVNTGEVPFVFLAVYHGDAGHDYGTIETDGFPQRVVRRGGSVEVVETAA